MSSEEALSTLQQYLNKNVVCRLVTQTQINIQQKQVNKTGKPIVNLDEFMFWKFIDTILVMILSPRTNMDEYWSSNEILGNPYIKKMITGDAFKQIYQSISWEDENNQNWLQSQIINTAQNQLITNHIETSGLNAFLNDSWNSFTFKEKQREFPYLHLPIHSDAFQKTMLQQKQQTKYYRRVMKQEKPLTEKQVKNINQMKTQDEHYKQLIVYIQFDHPSARQQTKQFIYCLQVCIINSFIIFRHKYLGHQVDEYGNEDNEQKKQQKFSTRDYIQLIVDALEPLITRNQINPNNQIQTLQNLVKLNDLFVPRKNTKFKISNSIQNIMQNHSMVPIKQFITEAKNPSRSCCMCSAKTRSLCSCNQYLCNNCHKIHLLIEYEQSQKTITQISQIFQ
ncbi:Transposase_IS4 [Hexamita inflata]|uniref:Transposase IS4 n=1 Tax=Hexamita inflata TaxID=28002 RepID=A0AA86NSN6_9EUKA|nr:Transposase IS4 [Hexamita inflata]